jgi:hypothetical protein
LKGVVEANKACFERFWEKEMAGEAIPFWPVADGEVMRPQRFKIERLGIFVELIHCWVCWCRCWEELGVECCAKPRQLVKLKVSENINWRPVVGVESMNTRDAEQNVEDDDGTRDEWGENGASGLRARSVTSSIENADKTLTFSGDFVMVKYILWSRLRIIEKLKAAQKQVRLATGNRKRSSLCGCFDKTTSHR